MPGQQRRWSDDPMQTQVAGEQTSQGGQDCSILWGSYIGFWS
jgi:hypothetical protein